MIKPMLAKTWPPKKKDKTYLAQPKIDGVRAICQGERFFTRNGNTLNIPIAMPDDYIFDGELIIPYRDFNYISGIVRRQEDIRKNEIVYIVFDIITDDPLEVRLLRLHEWAGHLDVPIISSSYPETCEILEESKSKVAVIISHEVKNDDVESILEWFVGSGWEGIMLRPLGSLYEQKRSSALLKYKSWKYMTLPCVGKEEGKGKYEDMLGAYILELQPGLTVSVGSGFIDSQRHNYYLFHLPKTVAFKYQELSKKGVPRFPIFINALFE